VKEARNRGECAIGTGYITNNDAVKNGEIIKLLSREEFALGIE